jgi:hypothetical protein
MRVPHCCRCGKVWLPNNRKGNSRAYKVPARCGVCGSPYWNKARREIKPKVAKEPKPPKPPKPEPKPPEPKRFRAPKAIEDSAGKVDTFFEVNKNARFQPE